MVVMWPVEGFESFGLTERKAGPALCLRPLPMHEAIDETAALANELVIVEERYRDQ